MAAAAGGCKSERSVITLKAGQVEIVKRLSIGQEGFAHDRAWCDMKCRIQY